jgi:hypothetical protein
VNLHAKAECVLAAFEHCGAVLGRSADALASMDRTKACCILAALKQVAKSERNG